MKVKLKLLNLAEDSNHLGSLSRKYEKNGDNDFTTVE